MPTAGYSAEPSYGSEWWGSGVANQHCTAVTMPEAGRITRIGVWLRGKDASCSFRGVVWSSTRNSVLGQTALQTASGAALAIGASLKYEAAVATPFDVAAGTIYVGFTRNPTGAMQFGFDNTGSHYDEDNNSSNPSGMTAESSHSSRRMGVYVVYEVGSETYVRRSGAWVKADSVQLECVCGRRVRSDGTFADGRHRKLHANPRADWGKRARLGDEVWEEPILAQLEGVELDDATIGAVVASLGSGPRPVALDQARIERQIRELALEHAAGRLEDAAYLERLHELRDAKLNLERTSTDGISPDRAVAWL